MNSETVVILFFLGFFGAIISVMAMYQIIDSKYDKLRKESIAWKRDHEAEWEKARSKALLLCWIPVVIGLLLSVPLINNIANHPSSRAYVCDYCGKTSEHSFAVGKVDLCYDCYQLYKKGK
ncbi:MAG: hypothetical protein ACI4MG_05200 [Aristaeellaceae bacterium]